MEKISLLVAVLQLINLKMIERETKHTALSYVYPELVSRSVREGTFILHSYPLSSDIEELNEPFPYTTGEGQLGKLPSFPSSDDGSL